MNDYLTDNNFLVYCAKVYDNPTMHSSEEFIEDLNRLKYIKKLLTRYIETGELKERLILNHIITLHNCFGSHLSKIMFLKMENQFYLVKPFLVLINALPKKIYNVGKYAVIDTDDYPLDKNIIAKLRGIL
jgi:hypothetical protein